MITRGQFIPQGVELDSPTWSLVLAHAIEMERKLAENRHKGGRNSWLDMSTPELLRRLRQEAEELVEAIAFKDEPEIRREAADVSNFAMFIADKEGKLQPYEYHWEDHVTTTD